MSKSACEPVRITPSSSRLTYSLGVHANQIDKLWRICCRWYALFSHTRPHVDYYNRYRLSLCTDQTDPW